MTKKSKKLMAFIKARVEAGFKNQRELAEVVGIHLSQISRIENGQLVSPPRAWTIYKLSKALKIDETTILKWFL